MVVSCLYITQSLFNVCFIKEKPIEDEIDGNFFRLKLILYKFQEVVTKIQIPTMPNMPCRLQLISLDNNFTILISRLMSFQCINIEFSQPFRSPHNLH